MVSINKQTDDISITLLKTFCACCKSCSSQSKLKVLANIDKVTYFLPLCAKYVAGLLAVCSTDGLLVHIDRYSQIQKLSKTSATDFNQLKNFFLESTITVILEMWKNLLSIRHKNRNFTK